MRSISAYAKKHYSGACSSKIFFEQDFELPNINQKKAMNQVFHRVHIKVMKERGDSLDQFKERSIHKEYNVPKIGAHFNEVDRNFSSAQHNKLNRLSLIK